jgi:hypothetical protein
MQLRTPLRVLLRHGEFHTDKTKSPPKIALQPGEGAWRPIIKSFKKLARGPYLTADDIELFRRLYAGIARKYTRASDIGLVRVADYLPFLIAVRRVVEAHHTIEHRMKKLRQMQLVPEWQTFASKHGGIEGIIKRFFPKFMNLAPGLDTPNRIAAASDRTLLLVKGVGHVRLKAIRERCAGITENRDSDRVENVIR